MKKLILGFVTAVLLIGIAYGISTIRLSSSHETRSPLYDQDVKKANEAVLCDNEQHSCRAFDKAQNSGNVNVTIVANGKPVSGLEVDVANTPGAVQYYMKLTDADGIASFDGLPVGNNFIYFNGVNFPKAYGDSPTVPVTVAKDQTAERRIELKTR